MEARLKQAMDYEMAEARSWLNQESFSRGTSEAASIISRLMMIVQVLMKDVVIEGQPDDPE